MFSIGDKVYYVRDLKIIPATICGTYHEKLVDNGHTIETTKYAVCPHDYPSSMWEYADSNSVFQSEEDAKLFKRKEEEDRLAIEAERVRLKEQADNEYAQSQLEEFRKQHKDWSSLEELEKVLFESFKDGSLTLKKSSDSVDVSKYLKSMHVF